MHNREFANQSKKITINDAAAQKKVRPQVVYRIGMQKPAPKQLNNCGLKNICLAFKINIKTLF